MKLSMSYNKYEGLIALIVLLNINMFYLIDYDAFHISDLTIIVEMVLFLVVIVKFGIEKRKFRYGIWILACLFFAIISAYGAYLSYGQPIYLGIRPQRAWIVSMLMYFPISLLLKKRTVSYDKIVDLLEIISCIYMFIIFLQWLLPGLPIMKSVIPTSDVYRYGSVRLRVDTTYLEAIFYFEIINLFYKKHLKKREWFIILGTTLITVLITKSRMKMLVMLFCVFAMVILDKRTLKKFRIACAAVILMLGFCLTPYGIGIISSFFDKSFNAFGREVREIGRAFFLERIFSSYQTMILGVGYMNTRWEPSVVGARYKEYISYDDNGIIGLMFYYGVIFAIWAIVFSCKLIRDAYVSRAFGEMLFILSGLVGIYTLFPACYREGIVFALLCSLIEYKVQSKRQMRFIKYETRIKE